MSTTLIDTEHTGFYAVESADDTELYFIRWNKAHTARYAQQVQPMSAGQPARRIALTYRGQAPLHDLTPDHAYPVARALRLFATHAPYEVCMFCHRSLTEDLTRTLGMGHHCAAKHLHIGRRALETIYRHSPHPDGGTPVPQPTSHLRLVAAHGRLIEAA